MNVLFNKELMLDDLVYCRTLGRVVRVVGLLPYDGHNKVVVNAGGVLHKTFQAKFLEPIPLTEKILKSNDFDLNGLSEDLVPVEDRDFSDDTYVWQAGKFENDTVVKVCVYFDYRYNDCIVELETPNITTDSIRLKYVHELQHALRLCGIDKEIVVTEDNLPKLGQL